MLNPNVGPRTTSRHLPVRIGQPDGRVRLGMPASSSRGPGLAAVNGRDPAAEGSGVVVLMEPAPGQWRRADRWLLVGLLVADTAVVLAMLADLAWRSILVDCIALIGVAALIANAVGLAGCVWRLPRLMGFFATSAVVQFLLSALVLQSALQAVHCALQPILALEAMKSRATLLPAWFTTGRIGRAG